LDGIIYGNCEGKDDVAIFEVEREDCQGEGEIEEI
jgi:hypothetical protein